MLCFQFEAENIEEKHICINIHIYALLFAENSENYLEKYLFSDNFQEYHGTVLIGQFIKIDIFGNKLNRVGSRTHCRNRSVKKQITLLVFLLVEGKCSIGFHHNKPRRFFCPP